ncbi:MAG: hypothetical protein AAF456_12150 [Planctomycetota bacterium]
MSAMIKSVAFAIMFAGLITFSSQSAQAQDVSIQIPFSVSGSGQEFDGLGNDRFKKGAAMAEARDAAQAEIDELVASYIGMGVTVEVVIEDITYKTKWVPQVATWYSTCTISGYLVLTGPPWIIEYIFFLTNY